VFTFKLCFWQLPTGKTLHRRSPRFDPKCPACSHASECNDHMFQCKAISRRRWKSSFIQSTRKRAEDCKTDPKLVHILLAGIPSYFDSCSPPPFRICPLSTSLPPACHQPNHHWLGPSDTWPNHILLGDHPTRLHLPYLPLYQV
jgi:hypothetical protein